MRNLMGNCPEDPLDPYYYEPEVYGTIAIDPYHYDSNIAETELYWDPYDSNEPRNYISF